MKQNYEQSANTAEMTAEALRMKQNYERSANWSRWGPYLSERQWGTVREDYSPDGECWDYFTHDMSRSRAYRWGEDGLGGGLTDHQCRLALSVALWNGRDAILKERAFGLVNAEGNHGEDVKEEYFYLESTPVHSYMRSLYKYPHRYPYDDLLSRRPGIGEREFELHDTAALDNYFDMETTVAKESPDVVVVRLAVTNRGETADCWLIPQLTFRNTWAWGQSFEEEAAWGKPHLSPSREGIQIDHRSLGAHVLSFQQPPDQVIFTENETNPRVFGAPKLPGKYYKDGFHEFVVRGDEEAVNTTLGGTKAAGVYHFAQLKRDETRVVWMCLRAAKAAAPADWAAVVAQRKQEHDEYYASIMSPGLTEEEKNVYIQAAAGLLFSKQFYYYDLRSWLNGDAKQPPPPEARKQNGRNASWAFHFFARDVITMPDCWEYPWFAAWDLAFHAIAFAEIDVEFAKQQLVLLLREWYMSPSGALPAYEFQFDDVNPVTRSDVSLTFPSHTPFF